MTRRAEGRISKQVRGIGHASRTGAVTCPPFRAGFGSRSVLTVETSLRERVDRWWSDLFGLPESMLWQPGVTVGLHSGLGDYPGIMVAGRKGGVHVSLPGGIDTTLIDTLVEVAPADLLTPRFWKGFSPTSELKVRGPSVHAYTDRPLDFPKHVEQVTMADLATWRDEVSRRKWENSGFAGDVPVVFALRHKGELVAAANLTLFDGVPCDVGLLTHPKHRGKGYSTRVARAATSYAVTTYGRARIRTLSDDPRARAVSAALGFEDYCEQLAVVPRDGS